MLDTETKRRIDSARDILVGKVPDLKSQVEQITIALIYKFMDDMDAEAVDLGGSRSFFTGEYEKYAWSKLFDPRLGGHETLALYGEAIVRLNQNPGLPRLFRDIFKNAYLPYRDPETLKLFLKTINGFVYDHSERLGDAFEYLLSVLGSQGDAGQFRTPRHIIDFMVAAVNPQKGETVCDPACGTAGFLISAYKHILRQNTKHRSGDTLTPDDKRKLMQAFVGYDISPDMVRLSLVNLYLHGFTAPRVMEYDTLTSEERWGEHYDIILANPPFMSPKGGIKPHKKFSVQANRSEALFVDYIAEHIHPVSGRAAVIVPEGVIFKSEGAFKNIRKLLVDKHYLYAVVSLPAGVFQPYSGVKTSILFLDKAVAKKSDSILFVKVEADGFDLGAQRRPVEKNDLPPALKALQEFKRAVVRGEEFVSEKKGVLMVEKERVKANHSLSGDGYRKVQTSLLKFDSVKLMNVCDVRDGTHDSPKYVSEGYPLITSRNIKDGTIDFSEVNYVSEADFENINKRSQVDDGDIIMPMIGTIGNPIVVKKDRDFAIKNVALIKFNEDSKIDRQFLKAVLASNYFVEHFQMQSLGATQKFISLGFIRNLEIPLPPLAIQQQIVSKIEGYQRIINGAKAVVQAYKPQIDIDPEWEMVAVGGMVSIDNGNVQTEFDSNGDVACIKVGDMNLPENHLEIVTSSHWVKGPVKKVVPAGSIVFPKRGAAIATNKKRYTRIPCVIDNNCMALTVTSSQLESKFLFYFLIGFDLASISNSAGIALINNGDISSVQMPLPAIDIQHQIVQQIEHEQRLVAANKELITLYEQKITAEIAKLWQAAPAEVTA